MNPTKNSLAAYGISGHPRALSSIEARIDNAMTTPENQRNWWGADYLSAKAANSFQVRRTLRMRSRYEVQNNPRLWGVAVNNATDLIDKGPTLQCHRSSKAENQQIETLWRDWCAEVGFVGKLTTAKLAETVDGAGPLIFKTVNSLEHPVKLYPVDVEDDQITNPMPDKPEEWMTDGVEIDPTSGEPTSYSVLKYHPGDYWFGNDFNPLKAERVPASHVAYLYPKFRPGQVRGLPVFTPSLDLFTELRSFRKSTLEAAQTAANHSAVVETEAPPGYDDDDTDTENYQFRRVQINRNMMTVLPYRWKMSQFRSEHPNATYTEFVQFGIMEAIRPLAYPFHRAMGTSKDANFSSMKGDDTNYKNCLALERANKITPIIVEKAFRLFVYEAARAGLMPPGVRTSRDIPHEWQWPGFESLDPLVDAQADALKLASGLDTWQDFCARRGIDHNDHFDRLEKAQREIERRKITIGEPVAQSVTKNEDANDSGKPSPKAKAHNRLNALAEEPTETA